MLLFALAATVVNHWRRPFRRLAATPEDAIDALTHVQEWAKWMTVVQTALLATYGILLKDHPTVAASDAAAIFLVLTGASALCAAWVLSAIPSIRLRLRQPPDDPQADAYNIYEYSLYAG